MLFLYRAKLEARERAEKKLLLEEEEERLGNWTSFEDSGMNLEFFRFTSVCNVWLHCCCMFALQ